MDQENKITLLLNQTTPEQFILWLEDTTRQLRSRYEVFPGKAGQYSVDFAREIALNKAAIRVNYYITEMADEDTGNMLLYPDFDVMEFRWFSIGDRLQLKIEHLINPPFVAHVYRVMVEFIKGWPETSQEIVNHFGWELDVEEEQKSESKNDLTGYSPDRKILIDQACIGWADRGYLPKFNMSEYLDDFYRKHDIYLSLDQFKDALIDAGRHGLIVKVNSRWRSPANSPHNRT
jgi:hypothetical protein